MKGKDKKSIKLTVDFQQITFVFLSAVFILFSQKTFARKMSHPSVFLQVMSVAVKATDHAGQLIRDIMMKGSDLGIVQKTGEKDLQTLADRTANDCIVGSLKKVFKL